MHPQDTFCFEPKEISTVRAVDYLEKTKKWSNCSKKKKSGEAHRELRGKKFERLLYSTAFMKKMEEALRRMIEIYGGGSIYTNHRISLFDQMIVQETKPGGLLEFEFIEFTDKGLPKYLPLAYNVVTEIYLEQDPISKKKWMVRGYEQSLAMDSDRCEGLDGEKSLHSVLNELYPNKGYEDGIYFRGSKSKSGDILDFFQKKEAAVVSVETVPSLSTLSSSSSKTNPKVVVTPNSSKKKPVAKKQKTLITNFFVKKEG